MDEEGYSPLTGNGNGKWEWGIVEGELVGGRNM